MAKNDIGGFFVSLGLNIDKDSFETGNKLIDGVGNSFNKMIGAARNAAVVLAGTAIATAAVESQAGKLAAEIGISTEALELWKATAKIAGVDANGLVAAMSNVANVLQRIKIDGSGLEDFAKKLGELGIVGADLDMEKLLNLSPDELMKEVFNYAHEALIGGADKTQVQQIIKDILGKEGMQLFIDLERRGITIVQALGEADNRTYTDSTTNANAQNFMTEVRLLKQASESMSKLLGSEVADQLTGYVKNINDWIEENGDKIADFIRVLSENVGKLVDKALGAGSAAMPTIKKLASGSVDIVKDAAQGTGKLIHGAVTGDMEEFKEGAAQAATGTLVKPGKMLADVVSESNWAQGERDSNAAEKAIREYKAKKGYGIFKSIPYNELTDDLKKDFDKYATKDVITKRFRFAGAVKDGIMRPDGTVTQVAPDDWVFAARNVGDLAKAFIPQMPMNMAGVGNQEYVINQTFNISGSNDIPQVLKQQAYAGTQEGLLQAMQESSRRMQLMTGMR